MNTTALDLTADTIDVRDIIARVEEIGDVVDLVGDISEEYETLTAILNELKGNGGDEQWRGNWYPVTLICDSHFSLYVQEMLIDCGTVPSDLPYWVEIDWEATACNVRTDYTPVDIDGVTYWFR